VISGKSWMILLVALMGSLSANDSYRGPWSTPLPGGQKVSIPIARLGSLSQQSVSPDFHYREALGEGLGNELSCSLPVPQDSESSGLQQAL